MRPLVLLRPEPGLTASRKRAEALGLSVIPASLFAVQPQAWEMPADAEFDALVLTSANAVRHAGAGLDALRHLPVHAVGTATADAASAAGFRVATTGTSDIDALLDAIPGSQRLLHLAGADRRTPGPHRHYIQTVTVYRAAVLDAPLPPLAGTVVAVHSPRAGEQLAARSPDRAHARVAAISAAAANAVGDGWERVEIAERPDDPSLLALAARLCHTPPS